VNRIIPILLIISILIISGCTTTKTDTTPDSKPSENQSQTDGDILKTAIATKNPNLCEKISSSYQEGSKAKCYEAVALEEKTPDICQKVEYIYWRDHCYTRVAVEISSPAACEKIEDVDFKDSCYMYIADKTKDPLLCKRIQTPYIAEYHYCYGLTKQ